MKLATYLRDSTVSCGLVVDAGVIDIPLSWDAPDPPLSIRSILERGQDCLDQIGHLTIEKHGVMEFDDITILAPIPRPGKALALAGNYGKHIEEASLKRGYKLGLSCSPRKTTVPRPFLMPGTVVTGPDALIPWPDFSEQVDYEVELAVVIGKEAKCVALEEALKYVAGYTIANDISARSVTFKEGRQERPWDEFYDWLNGKWADSFLPMGPYLVTADEVGDPHKLDIALKVNGKVRQQANTEQMIFAVPEVVSFISHLVTLEPGDVIATGTPAGVAMASGKFLKPGDIVECSIEKLGILTNTMGDYPKKFYRPLA
jgi:2-keto-4-pentenoate hydratase/2-oxohepta-3-ene-1,7-dioic acid hydratase in catechol pathway